MSKIYQQLCDIVYERPLILMFLGIKYKRASFFNNFVSKNHSCEMNKFEVSVYHYFYNRLKKEKTKMYVITKWDNFKIISENTSMSAR